ncbi:hypothetical protein NDU88_007216 [Pleurodeles waltl]|uniref:Uncharacterized protein n=1 Tax=Pleurodeles waltl TaxID=8319 RepID=A0AAV7U2E1_PLEWA|nr:hypothetical protein NDU88_007216 [Pleurodeles waltl]
MERRHTGALHWQIAKGHSRERRIGPLGHCRPCGDCRSSEGGLPCPFLLADCHPSSGLGRRRRVAARRAVGWCPWLALRQHQEPARTA